MNRREFMERLEQLLQEISDSEREEALQYYSDYFDDAGPENEDSVIKDLGSPEQVAQKIKAELSDSTSEYSERGYEDTRFRDSQEMVARQQMGRGQGGSQAGAQSGTRTAGNKSQPEVKKTTNGWKIVAIILLCLLAAPVILPLGAAALAVVFGLVVAAVALCFGLVVAGLAILVSGIVVIGVGIAKLFMAPAIGLAVAGVGCLLFAVGVLLTLVILWCCVKVVPWLIRGIVGLIRYPFRKAGAKE